MVTEATTLAGDVDPGPNQELSAKLWVVKSDRKTSQITPGDSREVASRQRGRLNKIDPAKRNETFASGFS